MVLESFLSTERHVFFKHQKRWIRMVARSENHAFSTSNVVQNPILCTLVFVGVLTHIVLMCDDVGGNKNKVGGIREAFRYIGTPLGPLGIPWDTLWPSCLANVRCVYFGGICSHARHPYCKRSSGSTHESPLVPINTIEYSSQ